MLARPGGRLFAAVGCAKCHVPALAGRHGEVPLYSDLLLHDMGQALDDKIVQGEANGADWRTTPLVGLGLRQHYLHDGRATTLRDAVLAHGGEADLVRDRYFELAPQEQETVIRFLNELHEGTPATRYSRQHPSGSGYCPADGGIFFVDHREFPRLQVLTQ